MDTQRYAFRLVLPVPAIFTAIAVPDSPVLATVATGIFILAPAAALIDFLPEERLPTFIYGGAVPGTLVTIATPLLAHKTSILLLFTVASTGYWLWGSISYADMATLLYKQDVDPMLLGWGIVPVFTGIPLATVLLAVRSAGPAWLGQLGLLLLAASVATLFLTGRATQRRTKQ